MWTYRQRTGELLRDSKLVGAGYSGHGLDVNNPAREADRDTGPIPAGTWWIGTAQNHPHLGPLAMPLEPIEFDPHGRSGFFIHGDNLRMDHSASHGCIIMARQIREAISASGDHQLTVTP